MELLRRVGLIGDVHTEGEALAFVLSELTKRGAETLLQVGDIVDGPGDLNTTCALLQAHGVLCVRGNHERWFLANQMRNLAFATPRSSVSAESAAFLRALPATREFGSARGKVLLCHGLGEDDMAGVEPEDDGVAVSGNAQLQELIALGRYRFIVNGHTHRSMFRTFGRTSLINAGALHREYERCFTLIDFERGELQRFRHAAGSFSTDAADWQQDLSQFPQF